MSERQEDIGAEKGVLASLFDAPDELIDVAALIDADDFAEPRNGKIYEAMTALSDDARAVTPIAVQDELRKAGALSAVGGDAYINELLSLDAMYAHTVDPVGYALIVREQSSRRHLANSARAINALSQYSDGISLEEAVTKAETLVRDVADRSIASGANSLSEANESFLSALQERMKTGGGIQGVPSGFIDLDKATTGWLPGQFIIVAARPAVGKSTIAMDFARAAAFEGHKSVMMFNFEMTEEEALQRLYAAESGIEHKKIKDGSLDSGEYQQLLDVMGSVENSTLYLDHSPESTVAHIRSSAHRQKKSKVGLDLIVVDYLQLMTHHGAESRQQEVSAMSRGLKLLAKELEVPVIALSQLNRGPENRTDSRPKPSDMRESGSLEQDADIVLLLHRPEVADPHDQPGQAFLIVAKHRGGDTFTMPIIPLLEYAKFANAIGTFPTSMSIEEPPEDTPPDPMEDAVPNHPSEAPIDDNNASSTGGAW